MFLIKKRAIKISKILNSLLYWGYLFFSMMLISLSILFSSWIISWSVRFKALVILTKVVTKGVLRSFSIRKMVFLSMSVSFSSCSWDKPFLILYSLSIVSPLNKLYQVCPN